MRVCWLLMVVVGVGAAMRVQQAVGGADDGAFASPSLSSLSSSSLRQPSSPPSSCDASELPTQFCWRQPQIHNVNTGWHTYFLASSADRGFATSINETNAFVEPGHSYWALHSVSLSLRSCTWADHRVNDVVHPFKSYRSRWSWSHDARHLLSQGVTEYVGNATHEANASVFGAYTQWWRASTTNASLVDSEYVQMVFSDPFNAPLGTVVERWTASYERVDCDTIVH